MFVQSTWCHKQVLFGMISNVFAAFIGNKTEISVEILIVVDNKILFIHTLKIDLVLNN